MLKQVDDLGKVSDALEKLNKVKKPAVSSEKKLQTIVNDESKRRLIQLNVNDTDNKKSEIVDRSSEKSEVLFRRENIDKNLISFLKPMSFEAEQFKKLRTNILFPVSGKPPRSIMVTSAVPEEGKSFVSSNLAVSIAQGINEYVLLVDCDMRRPSIHNWFGFGDVPGLSDYLSKGIALSSLLEGEVREDILTKYYLSKGISLSSLLLKTAVKKLTILPGGNPVNNPAELLSSEQMSKFLREVTERYMDRFIIIDTPPPHLTSETNALARQVDGILLVVKCGNTQRKLVAGLMEMLGKEKILGVVMNRFDMRSSNYYGSYGKYEKYYGK